MPPIPSPQFNPSTAVKNTSSEPSEAATVATAVPVTPPLPMSMNHPSFQTTPYPYPYSSPFGYPPMMPPMGFFPTPPPAPFPPFGTPWGQIPGAGPSPHSDPRSSPPPENTGSVEELCARYNLSNDTEVKLEMLGFVIGDSLSELTEDNWWDVGFTILERNRVLKAYSKYKTFLKTSL